MMRGKGMVSPLNTPQLLEQSKLNADHSQCRGLREEAVNGEPAIVYQVAMKTQAPASILSPSARGCRSRRNQASVPVAILRCTLKKASSRRRPR